MMRLEDSIKLSIDTYPSLYDFSPRQQVLNQFFLTNGNGLEWYGGELIEWTELPDDVDELMPDYDWDKKFLEAFPHQLELPAEFMRKYLNEYFHWYPICCYANILLIPDNVQPDWLLGALETALYVLNTDCSAYDCSDIYDWNKCYGKEYIGLPGSEGRQERETAKNHRVCHAVLWKYRDVVMEMVNGQQTISDDAGLDRS